MDTDAEIVVFLDDSEESDAARQLLGTARLSYRAVPASGSSTPAAKLGDTWYTGLSGVELLVRGLSAESSRLQRRRYGRATG